HGFERRRRKVTSQIVLKHDQLRSRRRTDPARVWILLILLAYPLRDVVLDRRQRRHRSCELALLVRLLDLLCNHAAQRRRPSPRAERRAMVQRAEWTIGSRRDDPYWRDGSIRRERGVELRPQPFRCLRLAGRGREHVLVDETLLRECAIERQQGF